MRRLLLRAFIFSFVVAGVVQAGDLFPEWRGIDGQGHADAKNLPGQISESDAAWKRKVPGLCWSAPVVVGGKVWVTTGID